MRTQDQNGALEMELGDVKGRVDEDVLEVRALQEELASKAKLEVRPPDNCIVKLLSSMCALIPRRHRGCWVQAECKAQ